MISLSVIFPLMIVLLVMLIIGGLLSRLFPFEANVKKALVTILIYVAIPAIILQSIFQMPMSDGLLRNVFLMLVFSVLVNSLGITIGWLVLKFTSLKLTVRKQLAVLSGLGNAGFIGIPLCAAFFGAEGALLAAIFDAGQDLVVWSIVAVMLNKEQTFNWRNFKSFINPPVLAIIAGIIFVILDLKPIPVIAQVTEMLAGLTIPLAMIYLGMLLVSLYEKNMGQYIKLMIYPLLSKLIILPTIVILILLWITHSGMKLDIHLLQVLMVQSAMPTFTMASVIFAYFQADEKLAALTSVISTAIAFITIPVMLWIGQWILF